MTDFEERLLERIDFLSERIGVLESRITGSLPEDQKRLIEGANGDFICDVEAIAYLWGCAPESVRGGRTGTKDIKRLPGRKIRAIKREVLAALARRDQPTSTKALIERKKANIRTR